MNPVYTQFLKTFSKIQKESQDLSLEESRIVSHEFFTKNAVKESVYKVIDHAIPGSDNNEVPIRAYIPGEGSDFPLLLFFHSGGWAFGGIEEADPLCRKIANLANCCVVSVDYRLAPENPFPMALQDCYDVAKWLAKNAAVLNGDASRIAVGGESCGANLAAAVALMSRDKKEFNIVFQLLLYPATTNDIDEKAYAESPDKSFISIENMKMFWDFYLEKPEDGNSPYASPLKAASLEGLPPAFVITAEFDPLHVEGEAFARRLKESGVPVRNKRYPGAIHSFLSLPITELPERREAIEDIREELLKVYHR